MTRRPIAAAIVLALASPFAHAQQATPAQGASAQRPTTLDTLIVTGTRVTDRTVAESTAPIDIITPEALASTGTVELATALSRAVPSLNFPRAAINDGTDAMRPAQLRHRHPAFGLTQDRKDLRFSVSACLHSESPRSSCRENSTSAAPYFRGGLPDIAIHREPSGSDT